MSRKAPKVLLVGRTNVGKSSLFNRMTPEVKSLVFDQDGVTRDCLSDYVDWQDITFELVDTGGISLVDTKDEILSHVEKKVQRLVDEAALILFVVDGRSGLTQEDERIARKLRSLEKKVIVIANKIDTQEVEYEASDVYSLGFEHVQFVSAHHARGVGDLLDVIVQEVGYVGTYEKDDASFRVILLGKPNVGKSSLLNHIMKDDVSIVSDQAGTTRESLKQSIKFNKDIFDIIDTPGIRRKRSIDDNLEELMVKNSLQSVRKAHIVLLMMSADEPELHTQVLKLASYALEQGAALIVLYNKEDLMDEDKQHLRGMSLEKYEYLMNKFEALHISCKTGKNVGKVLPLVHKVWERYAMRFEDAYLSDMLLQALIKTPLYTQGKQVRFHGARQIGAAPMRIEIRVAEPQFLQDSQVAFFENVIRKHVQLKSVPVLIYITNKHGKSEELRKK